MRILFVASAFGPLSSAAGTVNEEIAGVLCNRGHEVDLLGPNSVSDRSRRYKSGSDALPNRCNAYRFGPRLKTPGITISFVILIFKAIPLALRAHVILCEYHRSHMASLCAAITSVVTRRPLVVRVHDLLYQQPRMTIGYRRWLVDLMFKWSTLWSFRRAHTVLVPGDELVEVCRSMYGLRDVVDVCYNGANVRRFTRDNRDNDLRRNIGSQNIVIFVGAITRGRGLDILLRAIPLIRRDIPELKVVIVGPSYPGPEPILGLRQLAEELGVTDCVEFTELSSALLPKYLASADVGIGELRQFTAYYGATPLKVVEYMASGCVVIAAKGSVSSHLIRDGSNGILATPGDSDDVARKIMVLFSNPEMADKIREKARQTVETTFSWDVIVTRLERKLKMITKANKRNAERRNILKQEPKLS